MLFGTKTGEFKDFTSVASWRYFALVVFITTGGGNQTKRSFI